MQFILNVDIDYINVTHTQRSVIPLTLIDGTPKFPFAPSFNRKIKNDRSFLILFLHLTIIFFLLITKDRIKN